MHAKIIAIPQNCSFSFVGQEEMCQNINFSLVRHARNVRSRFFQSVNKNFEIGQKHFLGDEGIQSRPKLVLPFTEKRKVINWEKSEIAEGEKILANSELEICAHGLTQALLCGSEQKLFYPLKPEVSNFP